MNVEQIIAQLQKLDPKSVPTYIDNYGNEHEIQSIEDYDGAILIGLEYVEEYNEH
ncbi:hypothetical protein GH892_03225 [Bacillus thuringiensis]|uniref:hypothetical protein n=1 Tax=Bacillus toyonensis TaxID=155322 RepID=UPI001298C183|nr:hypothetical protein [Bacillus thuringiensis]